MYMDQPGNSACIAVATCPQGSAQSVAPNATTNRQCAPCVLGVSFAALAQQETCSPVTPCLPGYRLVFPATVFADNQCDACPSGYFLAAAENKVSGMVYPLLL
jgi:hypothetical protein